jgi:hypothetical protein
MADEWVVVRRCNWLQEANFIASVLEGSGIPTQVADSYLLGIRPELANALGGVRVMVPESELQRAVDTLAAIDAADASTTTESETETP